MSDEVQFLPQETAATMTITATTAENTSNAVIFQGTDGRYKFDPKPTMTGYQSGLVLNMFFIGIGFHTQDYVRLLFDKVRAETTEHWEKVG